MDPILRLADEELRLLAADVQVQLERGTGTRPVAYMLAQARLKAAKAIVLFLDADPDDVQLIRRLQRELTAYNDMVTSAQQMLAIGHEANTRISERDRAELEEVIADMSDEDRRLNGFEHRGID
jgi:predicted RND superfamily exporter protein